MSGEPKTLTLTTRHGYAPVTYEMDEDNAIHRITLHLPPGAAWAGPGGAPVAARDEAAPLTATDAQCSECGGPATAYSTNTTPPLCANCFHVNRRKAAAPEGEP